jgi:hypothetical protein
MNLRDTAAQAYQPKREKDEQQRRDMDEYGWARAEEKLRAVLSTAKNYPKEIVDYDGEIMRRNYVKDAITRVTLRHGMRSSGTDHVYRFRADDVTFGLFSDHAAGAGPVVHVEMICTQCGELGWGEYVYDLIGIGEQLAKEHDFVCAACRVGVPSNCPSCGRSNYR